MRRYLHLVLVAGALTGCLPTIAMPATAAPAATVDGQPISMAAYQARLRVSQARDPFAGMPEAIPSPAGSNRLADFTIEQLIRETIIREQAAQHGIRVSDQAVNTRITQLERAAGGATFEGALARNGFTHQSFADYERALLAEVGMLHTMAKQRADSAAADLRSGQSFDAVVDRFNDDSGTTARHGEVGWVRPGDLPEPALAQIVETLEPGSISGVIETSRGFVIARALERRNDQVHLAIILVLAPSIDMLSPQGTPAWFTTFIDEREATLRRDGKITVTVGSRA